MSTTPGIVGVSSIIGLNFLNDLAQSNSAFLVMPLAPFEERLAPELGVDAITAAASSRSSPRSPGATAFAVQPAADHRPRQHRRLRVPAAGPRRPRRRPSSPQVMRGLIVEANQQPELSNVFSTFAADTPQLYLDLDRDKAQTLGVQINDVFTALQGTLGGLLHQRLQPVRPHLAGQHPGRPGLPQGGRRHLQGPRAQRAGRDGAAALAGLGAPRARAVGADPLQPLPQRRPSTARRRRATAPATRSPRWSGSRRPRCRPATASSGPARRCRRRRPPARPRSCSALAILFAYLFLVALYESWNIPIPVLLSVIGRRARRDRRGARSRA